jgi:GrpB-like predicted nucleotidyltransferase (UPF0157 family)
MDDIEIVAYDQRWPALFAAEVLRLRTALPADQTMAIEHAGSTAIVGMAAKPIIDIYVAVPSVATAKMAFLAPLESLGYRHWADNPNDDEMFFVKGLPPDAERRTHHVHVVEAGSEAWRRPLEFRDYLRRHPDEAERYLELKLSRARKHPTDREAYTAAKEAYVQAVLKKARQHQPSP